MNFIYEYIEIYWLKLLINTTWSMSKKYIFYLLRNIFGFLDIFKV